VPERYAAWRLTDYDPRIVAKLTAWAAGDLWSLFLAGSPGTRKSSVAAAICYAAGAGYFATPEKSIAMIREFCDWWIAQAKTCPLIVFDDLGSYRATPHVHDTLLSILANRYDNFRKTIVTSNASLKDIAHWLDPRLADRLREGLVLESGTVSRRATGNEE
jgi:DNA replication protein DnaC